MERGRRQRQKLLILKDILTQNTDENHPMSIADISTELLKCEVTADRKALYEDFEALRECDVDVIQTQIGKRHLYYIGGRDFELPELKLLVDAVQSSKFITSKKSDELIGKIEGLASVHEAKQLQRQVYVANRNKTINEKIYYNVDRLHGAISNDKKIKFHYFNWNLKKEMELKHNGDWYEVSPWGLCWDDENYYLIAFDSAADTIKHYRVDKMVDITELEMSREGAKKYADLDMAIYSKQVFGMFSGEPVKVSLNCDNDIVGVIVDRFGLEIMIMPKKDDTFNVNVEVVPSTQFLGWIASLDGKVRITGPEDVKGKMKEMLMRNMEKY